MSGKKGSKWGNSEAAFLDIIYSIESSDTGCKPWPLGKDKDGYGYYAINGKTYIAHRLLYGLVNPGDFQGLVVMHSCDNRACCNIHHLSIGTISENTLDMVRKRRNVKGSSVGTAKLTEEQATEIRSKYPSKSSLELASEYGVCKQTICNVINETTFVNCSHMNEDYEPVNKPIRIVL